MSKFDYRLKRLEAKTGIKYTTKIHLVYKFADESVEKQIQKTRGEKELRFDFNESLEEEKSIYVITAIPRPDQPVLEERQSSPPMIEAIDPSNLTDEELDLEIAGIQKELDNVKIKTKTR